MPRGGLKENNIIVRSQQHRHVVKTIISCVLLSMSCEVVKTRLIFPLGPCPSHPRMYLAYGFPAAANARVCSMGSARSTLGSLFPSNKVHPQLPPVGSQEFMDYCLS